MRPGQALGSATVVAAVLLFAARALAEAAPTELLARVRALLSKDQWRDALAELARAPGTAGSDPAVLALRGEALYRAGRFDEAIGVLAPLCDQPHAPARALLTLGLLRRAAGEHADGAKLVDRALDADPSDGGILYWAASFAPSNAIAIARLEAYLGTPTGEDPDRLEAARGSLEFFRAIGERKTWIAERRPEHLEAPLRPLGGRGVVRGWVIDVRLGPGAAVPLLLDTGGGGLFLLERVARKRGFTPLASETAFGGGGDGRHATKRGLLPAFSIGALRFRDALVNTSTAEIEPTGRYQGILGLDVFEGYRVTLDLERGRLILDAASTDSSGTPYWSVSGQILVTAGPRDGPTGLFMVDTGATGSVVDVAFASTCPGAVLTAPARVRAYGGAVRDARSVRGLRLAYEGREVPPDGLGAVDLSLRSRMAGVEVSGYLGLDLWNGSRVVLDTLARRIRVQSGAGGGSRTLTPARSGGS